MASTNPALGIDTERGEAWVSGTGGDVWRLGGIMAGFPSFRITAIKKVDGSNAYDLTWESVADGQYDIEFSPSLESGPWSLAAAGINGLATSTTARVTADAEELHRFWRVRRTN